jgi:DnaJ homolog subfamily C member 19
MKIVWILLLAVLAWRLFTGRWPWQMLSLGGGSGAGASKAERRRARILLGTREGASREDIIEAHRNLLVMVHPDRGGTNEAVHEANHARDLLLEELAARNSEQS